MLGMSSPKKKTTKKKTTKTRAPRAASSSSDNLVVASKVKAYVRDLGLRSDGLLAETLSRKVKDMLKTAAHRVQARGQSTIKPHDL